MKRHSIPPLDRGLRSIVAQQVRNLLLGGWPVGEIKAAALELAAKYDRFNGHREMTHLQRLMEVDDEAAQERRHNEQKFLGLSADAIRALGFVDRSAKQYVRPDSHPFTKSEEPNTCLVCRGPIGVHVRPVSVGQNGAGLPAAQGGNDPGHTTHISNRITRPETADA